MYKLDNFDFGEKLKSYRKMKNYSMEQLGNIVGKTRSAIWKYEKNEVCPDAYTIAELCNALDISIEDLYSKEQVNNDNDIIIHNPFKLNKLYMYYISHKKIVESLIEIKEENNIIAVTMYNGINRENESSKYIYKGKMSLGKEVVFMQVENNVINGNEQVNIIIDLSTILTKEYKGIIIGLTKRNYPVTKKIVITEQRIKNSKDKERVIDNLIIKKEELDDIKHENCWILKNDYNDAYFIEF